MRPRNVARPSSDFIRCLSVTVEYIPTLPYSQPKSLLIDGDQLMDFFRCPEGVALADEVGAIALRECPASSKLEAARARGVAGVRIPLPGVEAIGGVGAIGAGSGGSRIVLASAKLDASRRGSGILPCI